MGVNRKQQQQVLEVVVVVVEDNLEQEQDCSRYSAPEAQDS